MVDGTVRAQCPMNCSENGVCMDSLCECDDGWSGKACEELMLEAVSFPQGYGSKRRETAWGAGVLKRFDLYHMFVTTMEECKGSSVSVIEHAVSANATGPYELKNVAVAEMASSPTPLVLPDGTFALFQGGAVVGTGRACRRRAEPVRSNAGRDRRSKDRDRRRPGRPALADRRLPKACRRRRLRRRG